MTIVFFVLHVTYFMVCRKKEVPKISVLFRFRGKFIFILCHTPWAGWEGEGEGWPVFWSLVLPPKQHFSAVLFHPLLAGE
jgi:hypothetical protein